MYLPKVTPEQITAAALLLSSQGRLLRAMCHVAFNWRYAAAVNLSNRARNRQAWLGQAACSYAAAATENATKQAWRSLSDEQRIKANGIADWVTRLWEHEHAEA